MELMPSQVIRTGPQQQVASRGQQRETEPLAGAINNQSSNNDRTLANNNRPPKSGAQKKRQRGRNKQQQQQPGIAAAETPAVVNTPSSATADKAPSELAPPKANENQPPKKRNRNRSKRNNNNKTDRNTETEGNVTDVAAATEVAPPQEPNAKQPKKQVQKNGDSRKKKNNQKRNETNTDKDFPWKSKVPEDAVDPITLDHIRELKYPPFALVANDPYVPIEEWPIPDDLGSSVPTPPRETEEERQRRILAEQWGEQHGVVTTDSDSNDNDLAILKMKDRHVNLYDGRALAYYMVSQLQFIDPLNRRDLTRDEINNLDRYLRRHGFHDLNVTEAYDAKGITLSTAGAAANTATGRAAILQQEARNLLNALFGNSSVAQTSSTANNSNTLMQQYLAHEAASTEQNGRRRQRNNTPRSRQSPVDNEDGIYGGSGFMVIDDELNPGLRTETNPDAAENQQTSRTSSLWSSSHITSQHGSGGVPRAWEFPSLATVAQQLPKPSDALRSTQRSSEKKPPSKTLANIGSAIKKTDPEELQRQFEAREEAIRRAMMANLTFGSNPSAMGVGIAREVPKEISAVSEGPSIEQLNRNRAFAEALGVVPSTVRGFSGSLNAGWARPSEGRQLDEFGNELNTTVYPDSLILQARDKMALLVKLEKRWQTFLADDTAASLPLNKMDRPTRAMVHEYAAFWNLRTESFDPEPRRYIHCAKLQDTRAPHPLLSDATRSWRGPTLKLNPLQPTVGQITERYVPIPSERIPLVLKPRSEAVHGENTATMSTALERERPKLELQERTLPLEMPMQKDEYDIKADLANQRRRADEKRQKEREEAERKQRLLEAAFASDDEEQSVLRDDDDSDDWEEQAPLYTGSEES